MVIFLMTNINMFFEYTNYFLLSMVIFE